MSISTARERYPAAAQQDFREAWAGLPVTAEQERYLRWCEIWDQPTLNAFADVIRLARQEVPLNVIISEAMGPWGEAVENGQA